MKPKSTIISKLIFLVILVSCKVTSTSEHVVINELISIDEYGDLSVEQFKNDFLVNELLQICEKTKVFDSIQESYVLDGSCLPLELATIVSGYCTTREYDQIVIRNGYPEGNFTSGVFTEEAQKTLKTVGYVGTDISGIYEIIDLNDSLLYRTNFKKGNGYWKDYYVRNDQLKEEGLVRNNYKSGEWKYFGQSGELDSTKNYTLDDSVDVRFPYCLFNKMN